MNGERAKKIRGMLGYRVEEDPCTRRKYTLGHGGVICTGLRRTYLVLKRKVSYGQVHDN
ncbi:MAG: hypothetical protein JRI94_00090 [Deltaproteobacteria bacterium]|nr:hypothetical protein [Deltaproteobacteria bacterium]MBW2031981.1 hypothetical protein [Deltaproteobacteria bacterium]